MIFDKRSLLALDFSNRDQTHDHKYWGYNDLYELLFAQVITWARCQMWGNQQTFCGIKRQFRKLIDKSYFSKKAV